MQLPEKYKENFDVLCEGPLSGVTVTPDEGPSLETSKFSLYFSASCIPTNESLFLQYSTHVIDLCLFKVRDTRDDIYRKSRIKARQKVMLNFAKQ